MPDKRLSILRFCVVFFSPYDIAH